MKNIVDLYKCNDVILNDAFDRFVVDLHLKKQKEGYQTFALCGSESRVGTTTIAINFALSTAASGWKTVLIDADISKGVKGKRLNDQVGFGIVEYLMEECILEDIIYNTNNTLLDYIPSGIKEDDMVRLLCSTKMDELFEELKDRYDFIIFDLPAMDASVDTTIFCAKSDCAILVTNLEASRRGLEEAKDKLKHITTKSLGVIVNEVDEKEYQNYLNNNLLLKKVAMLENRKSKKDQNGKDKTVELAATKEKETKRKNKSVGLKTILFCLLLLTSIVTNSADVFAAKTTQQVTTDTDYSKSRVILSSYEIIEGKAKPGEQITLKITLKNTSLTKNAEKLLITFTSQNGEVYPILGETGQLYMDSIESNQEKEALINMKISDKVDVDHVLVNFNIEFYDAQFGYSTNSTYIALPIQEENLLEVNNLTVGEQTKKDAKTLVSVKYSNTSATEAITNLVMHIDGDISEDQKEVLLGEVGAGKQLYTDYYVTFDKAGEQKLVIYFTYTDESSNTYTSPSTEYVVQVADETSDNVENITDSEKTNHTSDYIRLGALVVLIVVVIFIVVKRRK